MLTGQYQNCFGHEYNIPPRYSEANGLNLDEVTIADALKGNGYCTIALGKWHLGYAPKFHPMERGFTDYYGFLQGQRSYFPLKNPMRLNRLLRDREPVKEELEYMTDELGRAAAEYFVNHNNNELFVYMEFGATRGPNDVPEADLKKLSSRQGNVKHRAMTAALDRAVGVVLDELDNQKIADHTLVIFMNDNGGATGHDNVPLRGHKESTWEGGRIPFPMRWPAVLPKGKAFDHPVMTIDIFPTALAAAGIAKTPGEPLDGVNLLPFAKGENTGCPHQTLFWKNGDAWAVRDGDLKLVDGHHEVRDPELFDLVADPTESKDLAVRMPDKVKELRAKWDAWNQGNAKPTWGNKGE